MFKANFNGAVFKECRRAGLGVVVRNHEGQVVASLAENITLPSTSDDVEAIAAVRAINFTAELGLPSVIIECDSELVIKALNSEEESLATFGHLLVAVRPTVNAFRNINFNHIRRQGNSLTHNLARHVSDYQVWMEDIPPHLLNVLLTDVG